MKPGEESDKKKLMYSVKMYISAYSQHLAHNSRNVTVT